MISTPIAYCSEDQKLVAAFETATAQDQSDSYWSDPGLEALRSRVKQHYIDAQGSRCCYCNRRIPSTNHRHWDVEHVVARILEPHFMFEPCNLAAACPDCNIQKGTQNVLINKKRKTYPRLSKDFLIVHPHFDRYDDHIFQQGMIYVAKTEKGKRTIYMCDLLRFAQEYIDWENSVSDTTFEKEVDSVLDGDTRMSQAAVVAIVAKLNEK
jgi:5-methylcytosine-specific restriction endonuclease McrA